MAQTEMMKDLKEAIAKNLPATVGIELKQRLEQAERDERDLAAYKSRCENLEVSNRASLETNSKLHTELEAFKAREADLLKREKEIQKLELTAKFAEEKTDLVRGLFGTVFQNRIVRENALVPRERVERTDYAGGGGQTSRYHEAVEESKTREEG